MDSPTQRTAWAALFGGAGWALVIVGWVAAHGSTPSPRGAEILGLDATGLWGLLAAPAFLLAMALASARSVLGPPDTLGRAGAGAYALAVASSLALAASLVLQSAIVDPDLDFGHPFVQGGWLLYLVALVPGLAGSMSILGASLVRRGHPLGLAALLVGVAAVAPVVGGTLHSVADGSPAWDAVVAAVDALFGVAWMAFGCAVWTSGPRPATRAAR